MLWALYIWLFYQNISVVCKTKRSFFFLFRYHPSSLMYTDHTKTTKFFNELLSVDDILNTPKKTEIQISTIKLQDFDPEIQSWVIEKQLEPLIKYFSFPPSEINAWKNYIKKLAICHNNAKIVMPDGRIFKRTQGLISGAKEYKYFFFYCRTYF